MSLIREAVDPGVTLFGTAEAYGPSVNEKLVGEAVPRQNAIRASTLTNVNSSL
jgi:aryl-alcohol dehydrogenase-like predicted oxidoreductase